MARRSSVACAAAPSVTVAFKATDAGGSDGRPVRLLQLTCDKNASNPMQYRLEDPADPDGEWATLYAEESVLLSGIGSTGTIKHVSVRGVGGASTANVEVVQGT